MYIPPHFREERIDILHGLIGQHSLAALVTLGADGLLANHVPLIVEPGPGPLGTLRGHLSKANRQWKDSLSNVQALAIFQGPSAYITPSWYPSKLETGQVVPTYNYAVVHAHGTLATFDDPDLLEAHLRKLTNAHEAAFADRWSVDDAPASFIRDMLKGIVGIEIPIERLEGKWKLSQNRTAPDRAGTIEGLTATSSPAQAEMAEWMSRKIKEG